MRYSKYSGRGNFFSLPNEVFLLGLSAGELSVYSFLKRCENRKTHQCWPSIRTIGEAVRMSENTVRKYIRQLEERGLITTEPTEVITKTGEKRNGNLLNDHLWEGRYSPIVNGQRMARNVYAKTEAECEEKLAELIRETKAEIAAGKEQAKQQKPAS